MCEKSGWSDGSDGRNGKSMKSKDLLRLDSRDVIPSSIFQVIDRGEK